jgi:ABC-type dipeptide/oligopeptide/nickel transport system permease component
MAVFTISAILTLVGMLVADVLYSLADPRISYGKKSS